MKKKIIALVLCLVLVGSFAFAANTFTPPDTEPGLGNNGTAIQSGVETILGAAQWIGFIVGIAMIIYVGVKYLTAGAGKKAEVKSTMIPILVGAALVALAPSIAHWIFNMFGN